VLDLSLIKDAVKNLSKEEVAELDALLTSGAPMWVPLPGPQTRAYYSGADVMFYGGAAGGGKSDLLIGSALTEHSKSIIFRREGTQLQGIFDRMAEIIGTRDGFNSKDKIWRLTGRQVEFGSVPHVTDVEKYQGRPHDLKGFDEICHFTESQFRFLAGWLRTTREGQRTRIICTGNPPTTPEGQWVKEYWGPWLMPDHHHPAKPGQILWYAMIDGKEEIVESGEPFEYDGDMITPQSRTFIPSKVEDNVFLMETGYKATLQSLPEPLRSQMLKGDFNAGMDDPEWQVIPSAWVDAAMARWVKLEAHQSGPMSSMGVDCARGGRDDMIIARRHNLWFDEPVIIPGADVPDGPTAAGRVINVRRDRAPVHIDVIGVGSSPTDFLRANRIQTIAVNNAAASMALDSTGELRFFNKRAETYWGMREALDPVNGLNISLPPNPRLRADLTAAEWRLTPRGIQVEAKEKIKERIGRSTDYGDAYILALLHTDRDEDLPWNVDTNRDNDYDPIT